MAVRQLVKFSIEDENFGIEITQVKEIIKPQEIFKVPNTPPFIEGLINLRDNVLTVFNLRKRFGMPNKDYDDNTKIIIINVNNLMVGFTVDIVSEIVRVDDNDIESTPPSVAGLDKKFLSGIAKVDQKLILLLDLTRVLSSEEENKIKEFVEENKSDVN